MSPHRSNYKPSAADDDWEDIPSTGVVPKYFGGVIIPAALIVYGIVVLATGHGNFGKRGMSIDLYAEQAVSYGVVLLSGGMFLHCHYFWGNLYHLSAVAVVGKIIGLMGFILGSGYLIVRIGFLG